jgi:hypothetical protein
MSDDWIKKIVDAKAHEKQSRELAETSAEDDKRKFEALVDSFGREIAQILKEALDEYNSQVSDDQRIQHSTPPHFVLSANKVHYPAGKLTVAIDRDRNKLVCSYSFVSGKQQLEPQSIKLEYKLVVTNGSLGLQSDHRQLVPRNQLAQTILTQLLSRI